MALLSIVYTFCPVQRNPIVKYNEAEKEKILKAYQERQSMRGIKRTFGVAIPTLIEWLKKKRK